MIDLLFNHYFSTDIDFVKKNLYYFEYLNQKFIFPSGKYELY